MGYRGLPLAELPQELRNMCNQLGYIVLQGTVAHSNQTNLSQLIFIFIQTGTGPVTDETIAKIPALGPDVVGHAENIAKQPIVGHNARTTVVSAVDYTDRYDAISISSGSTDRDAEGTFQTFFSYGYLYFLPVETELPPVAPVDDRWYAITVGRNPGVFRGS